MLVWISAVAAAPIATTIMPQKITLRFALAAFASAIRLRTLFVAFESSGLSSFLSSKVATAVAGTFFTSASISLCRSASSFASLSCASWRPALAVAISAFFVSISPPIFMSSSATACCACVLRASASATAFWRIARSCFALSSCLMMPSPRSFRISAVSSGATRRLRKM